MVMKILKKEFNNIFKAYHDRDTQIWVATGVNELDRYSDESTPSFRTKVRH